jgi:hypothetical protein
MTCQEGRPEDSWHALIIWSARNTFRKEYWLADDGAFRFLLMLYYEGPRLGTIDKPGHYAGRRGMK